MNMRLKKVLDDIQKTENKILELQEHVRQLRIQKKQMEDAEIIKAIRSMKMDSQKDADFSGWNSERNSYHAVWMKRAIFLWIVLKQV